MRLFGLWNRFINDGLHRCDCCGCVMFKVDDDRYVCLKCGNVLDLNINKLYQPDMFSDTCSEFTHGKDNNE